MPPLSVLIKPASSNCNLRCTYCFYHDEAVNRDTRSFGMMQPDTIDAIVQKALAHASGSCTFGFQGGEPTLAGLPFFQHVIELQQKYNTQNIVVHNALQTNGTLIDDAFAQFFHDHEFLIGLSLDGNESLHDLYRRDASADKTHARIMHTISLFRKYEVQFNVLTVITAQTAKHIRDVYAFFMRNGLVYQQYIPCLDPLGEPRGKARYSLTPELYARFLKTLFDLWYQDRSQGKFVYIRYFENLAALLLGQRPESCGISGLCALQYAFEADGSVYPCDFYMLDDYRLGNIHTENFPDFSARCDQIGFIAQSARLPAECLRCRWRAVCRDGCRRDRIAEGAGDSGRNYYCAAYQEFFAYALPRLQTLLPPRGGGPAARMK